MQGDQTYLHMKELIDVIEERTSLEMGWFDRCKLYCEDLKTWKPEIYITIKDGVVVSAVANTSMHVNILDIGDESKNSQQEIVDWLCIIGGGTKKGFLKNVMK
jgi:hypothetical protein